MPKSRRLPPDPSPVYHCPRCRRLMPCTDPQCEAQRQVQLRGIAAARAVLKRSVTGDPPPPPTVEDTYA